MESESQGIKTSLSHLNLASNTSCDVYAESRGRNDYSDAALRCEPVFRLQPHRRRLLPSFGSILASDDSALPLGISVAFNDVRGDCAGIKVRYVGWHSCLYKNLPPCSVHLLRTFLEVVLGRPGEEDCVTGGLCLRIELSVGDGIEISDGCRIVFSGLHDI